MHAGHGNAHERRTLCSFPHGCRQPFLICSVRRYPTESVSLRGERRRLTRAFHQQFATSVSPTTPGYSFQSPLAVSTSTRSLISPPHTVVPVRATRYSEYVLRRLRRNGGVRVERERDPAGLCERGRHRSERLAAGASFQISTPAAIFRDGQGRRELFYLDPKRTITAVASRRSDERRPRSPSSCSRSTTPSVRANA